MESSSFDHFRVDPSSELNNLLENLGVRSSVEENSPCVKLKESHSCAPNVYLLAGNAPEDDLWRSVKS